MGILTNGQYTFGNRTWQEIINLQTTAILNIGDTVFDTTYNKMRMWDGFNFVHTHQKSVGVVSGILNGAVMVVAANNNNAVNFQQGSVDTEGIIGIAEYTSSVSGSGSVVPVGYHGDMKALVVGSAGTPASTANYILASTTNLGYAAPATTTAVGDCAIYIDTTATTTGLRRIIFRPVERN